MAHIRWNISFRAVFDSESSYNFPIYYLLSQPHPVPPNHSIHSLSSSDSNHSRIQDDIPQPLAASEDNLEDGAPQQTSIVSREQSQLPYHN